MFDEKIGRTCAFNICSLCKLNCCIDANPPLTISRKKMIINFLTEHNLPTDNIFVNSSYSHPAADATAMCVFRDKETGKCRIHPVKPETCRAGPVTFDINLRTGKVEWYLKKDTICALAQQLHGDNGRFVKHFEVAKEELLHLIRELEPDALRAILRIPEPETFKIGEYDLPAEITEKLNDK